MVGQVQAVQGPAAVRELSFRDLGAALAAGWADFRACPAHGLFFGAIYVVAGLLLSHALLVRGEAVWLIPSAAAFPLFAPFAAVGLYEVSRRRESGQPVTWGAVLGALRGRGDEQLILMGGIVFVGLSFWIIIAHTIFAVFMAESGLGSESLEVFRTQAGMAMLLVGSAVGALIAYGFYAVTLFSLPMLVDRDVDFITAIVTSFRALRANRLVLRVWAAVIAAALFLAMLPLFLGLLLVLPVLGHATWHLYRRAVETG
jgi:uncharacterized membrane protein